MVFCELRVATTDALMTPQNCTFEPGVIPAMRSFAVSRRQVTEPTADVQPQIAKREKTGD
jgi:hypothetical protein